MATIMVTDDNAPVLSMETAILTRAGHRVVACASGPEALKRLGIQPDDPSVELPDLLLLDIMMPMMDGYTVVADIRNNPRTRGIPIIIVSVLQTMSPRVSTASQVDGFITKPFTAQDLVGCVANILKKRAQGRTSS